MTRIELHFTENPDDSLRKAAQILEINRESLRLILRYFLNWHPYKISSNQLLTEHAMFVRKSFADRMYTSIENEEFNPHKIIFSDEAHFYLNGYVNKQNYRYWGSENPHMTLSKPLHPERLTVWVAITPRKIYVKFIYENVTAEVYKRVLQGSFFPWLRRNKFPDDFWFMQDGATPHRTREVFEILFKKFGTRVIGLGFEKFHDGGIIWPPYSPDLNPCDFFLFGYLKDTIYKDNPQTLADLEKAIRKAINRIDADMIERVYKSFVRRLEYCANSRGGHFEHIFH